MQQSHLPPRFPQPNSLITPSASPPPRNASVQQQFNRPTMSAPPLKRQRVSSTPRRTLHDPSPASTSSRSQPPIDIGKEREASRLRLRSAWENLTRLVRPLDEDDIINLRTGKITRDNGVLRNTARINFGNMLSPADNEGGDEDTDSGDEEDEGGDETDELDTLTEGPLDLDVTTKIDFEAGPKVLPPVTPLDPQDNEDLQEFLKAEKHRKELCGSDPESEEDDEEDEGAEESQEERGEDSDPNEVQYEDAGVQEEDLEQSTPRGSQRQDVFQAPSSSGNSSDVGIGLSDDELDDWGVDDASFVQPVTKIEEEKEEFDGDVAAVSDSDSDIEIIEGPYVQSSPIRPTAPKFVQHLELPKSKSESPQKKITTQYLTPPHSSSSVHRSASFGEPESQPELNTRHKELQREQFYPPLSRDAVSSIPRVDLANLHKGRKPPILRASSSAGTSSSSSSFHPLIKTQIPKLKPIVLLTPRKASTIQSRVENPPSSSRVDLKGKQRAISSSPSREERRATGSSTYQSQNPEQSSLAVKPGSQKKYVGQRSSDPKSTAGPSNILDKTSRVSPSHKDDNRGQHDNDNMSSPRKRKRRSSSVDTRHLGATPHTERRSKGHTSSESDIPVPGYRRSSSRQISKRCPYGSDSEGSSSASDRCHSRRTSVSVSMSRPRTPSHTHQRPPYFPDSYSSRGSIPPFGPIPDPRAQFIITQAMQQLSALVTGSWVAPYEATAPPTYYPDPRYPNPYTTPTHRHASRYDPNFSNATHPPDSPDPSPEKSANGRPKSLVRRSRSRGRRVSFHIDGKIASSDRPSSPAVEQNWDSSPTKPPRDRFRKRGTPFSEKGKARETTYESSENSGSDVDKRSTYVRGQTPGPSWQLGDDQSHNHKSR